MGISGPDSAGYYFIENGFLSHSLNGSGTPPAITFGTASSTTQNNNTRWRLVKPYQPVTISSPVVPGGVSAVAGNQTVSLTWSNTDRFYNVYRSGSSGGPYTRIAGMLTNTAFVDNNVTNGVLLYYVVTGLNILGEESPYCTEMAIRPTSTVPFQLKMVVTDNNLIQLSWPEDHTGWELQVQTNLLNVGLGTNWVTVPNSSGTNNFLFNINGSNASVFFRLAWP